MLISIKKELDNGLTCYSECGGLMYLTEAIDKLPAVGFFKGDSFMSSSLQNFGYSEIQVEKGNVFNYKDTLKIKCHEFHKSCVELEENTIYKIAKTNFDGSFSEWRCGYTKNNTIGTYGHIHFFNCMNFIDSILENAIKNKEISMETSSGKKGI
jgi:cobyrinic acid a,c-diamide synthase